VIFAVSLLIIRFLIFVRFIFFIFFVLIVISSLIVIPILRFLLSAALLVGFVIFRDYTDFLNWLSIFRRIFDIFFFFSSSIVYPVVEIIFIFNWLFPLSYLIIWFLFLFLFDSSVSISLNVVLINRSNNSDIQMNVLSPLNSGSLKWFLRYFR
jgi:hypothetical protein